MFTDAGGAEHAVMGTREAQGAGASDLSVSEVEHLINEWIFSERDRAILKRRLIDGIPYEPLAGEFDMSVTQIKRIVKKGQTAIFKHFP